MFLASEESPVLLEGLGFVRGSIERAGREVPVLTLGLDHGLGIEDRQVLVGQHRQRDVVGRLDLPEPGLVLGVHALVAEADEPVAQVLVHSLGSLPIYVGGQCLVLVAAFNGDLGSVGVGGHRLAYKCLDYPNTVVLGILWKHP